MDDINDPFMVKSTPADVCTHVIRYVHPSHDLQSLKHPFVTPQPESLENLA